MSQISPNVSSGPYTGNGVQVAFTFGFSIVSSAGILVQVNGSTMLPATYNVAFGDTSGTVTFVTPPAVGAQILLTSNPDYVQTSNFDNQGDYNLATINLINKRAVIRDLVLKNRLDTLPGYSDVAAAQAAAAAAMTQAGISTTQAGLAGVAAVAAGISSTAAAIAAASLGVYKNSASGFVPQGAVAYALTPGSGGANGTNIAATFSGGSYQGNPTILFDIVGGAVTNVRLLDPGFYIGGSISAPTVALPGAAGGAALTLTNGYRIGLNSGYWVQSTDGNTLDRYKNVAGVATSDTASIKSIPTATYIAAALAALAAAPNLARDRYGNFYDPHFVGGNLTAATDDGRYNPSVTTANRWVLKATGTLAPGASLSAYVRSTSGTYGATASNITFLSNVPAVISTTNFGATDADGARSIDNLTIPALTDTIQIDYYPASVGDIYEAHVAAGPATTHLQYVKVNRVPVVDEHAIPGVRREIRGFGNSNLMVNVPNGDVRVYQRIVVTRGGSLSGGELAALYALVEGLRVSGLMDKAVWIHPLVGTGLGALDTPLLDRFGIGRMLRPVGYTTWDPTLGLLGTYPSAQTAVFDTTIVPSEHGFRRNGYGYAMYILSNRGVDAASIGFGSSTANITAGPQTGFYPLFAGFQIVRFTNTGTSASGQVLGIISTTVGSGAGLVTSTSTTGSHIGSRRRDGTGVVSFNGYQSGETSLPIDIADFPDESVKVSNYGDTFGFLALFNAPLELWEHTILARLMHRFNKAVRATPPVIEGGF